MNLSVRVGDVSFSNPIILASGTCGFGRELKEYMDFSKIGGISSKGLTLLPREGNEGVRIAETPSGILNSVGLQNPGVEAFLQTELDFMNTLGTKVIVNIAGHSTEDYVKMVEILGSPDKKIDALELNFSCPNVTEGCMSIGTDPEQVFSLMKKLRPLTKKPLWVKLTPNVTDITQVAAAAEAGGADAIVLINTLLGMKIDVKTRRPVLQNNTGGLSGPAVRPVAVRMTAQCYQAVKIPIIGLGGIATASDILEFMIAGASAVQVGTASLVHPNIAQGLSEELSEWMEKEGVKNIAELTGSLQYW